MLQLNITPKLAIVLVLFAAALLTVVGTQAYQSGHVALLRSTTSDLLSTALEKEASLESWLEERETDVVGLAASSYLSANLAVLVANPGTKPARAAHDRLVAELNNRTASGQAYLGFLVLDAERGQVIAATDPAEEGQLDAAMPYFVEGKRGSYIQNPYYSDAQQTLMMSASAPLRAADGRLLGVLVGQLNLAELEAIIARNNGLRQSRDTFLLNASSLFVTQPQVLADSVVLQRSVNTEASRRCLAGGSGTLLADDYRGVPVIVVYRWLAERQLCLIVKVDQTEAFAPARDFGVRLLIISGVALLVSSAIAFALAQSITRPLLALEAGTIRFRHGDRTLDLPETSGDEVGRLAREFNAMAVALSANEVRLEQQVQARTAELQAAQGRLSRLVDANHIGIAVAGAGGEIFEANDYYLNLLGYTRSELDVGQVRWIDMTPPEHLPADERALAELQATGICTPYEKEYFRKDGARVWVMITDAVLPQEDGKIIALVQDVTDRKRFELALARSAEELRRSNAELERFAYVASHDLQEPLRMVASYTQLLARRYQGQLDADAHEFIGYAMDGASRMQILINDLLAYSRVGTRGQPFEPVDCNIELARVTMNLKVAIEESRAIVTHDQLPVVSGDAPQIMRVFLNLVGNAIKFRGAEPPRVHVGVEEHDTEWIFSVCDNGIGIDPQYAERIFVIFQRLHTHDEYPGSGMGLAICKKIIERHGGQIWLDADTHGGARFRFTLPCRGGRQ
jgi:PAS domain S-box-containing protein